MIIEVLCQTGFQDKELLNKLRKNRYMSEIVNLFEKSNIQLGKPGYHRLSATKAIGLHEFPYVIEQIQLRAINEREMFYSVALNHLLNELHAICRIYDRANNQAQEYTADLVTI